MIMKKPMNRKENNEQYSILLWSSFYLHNNRNDNNNINRKEENERLKLEGKSFFLTMLIEDSVTMPITKNIVTVQPTKIK